VRYQATSEISAELRSLKQAIESGRSVTLDLRQAAAVTAATPGAIREPPLQKRSRLLAMMSVLALVVVVVAGTWLFLSRRGGERAGPLRVIPFSGLSGFEDHAAFSPDGKQLAYVWDGGSGTAHHIYVNLIGIGSRLQLTHDSLCDMDPALVAGRTLHCLHSVFSWFERQERSDFHFSVRWAGAPLGSNQSPKDHHMGCSSYHLVSG